MSFVAACLETPMLAPISPASSLSGSRNARSIAPRRQRRHHRKVVGFERMAQAEQEAGGQQG